MLHFAHKVRQRRLGRTGSNDQKVLAAQVLREFEDIESAKYLEHQPKDAKDEDHTRDVEGQHQDCELFNSFNTGCANHTCNRAESANRCEPQHHHQNLKHELLQVSDRS